MGGGTAQARKGQSMSTITAPQVSLLEDQVQDIVRKVSNAYAMYQRKIMAEDQAGADAWLERFSALAQVVALMARVDLGAVAMLMADSGNQLGFQGDWFGAEVQCERALYSLLADIHS